LEYPVHLIYAVPWRRTVLGIPIQISEVVKAGPFPEMLWLSLAALLLVTVVSTAEKCSVCEALCWDSRAASAARFVC
jgi:hypothetical protein